MARLQQVEQVVEPELAGVASSATLLRGFKQSLIQEVVFAVRTHNLVPVLLGAFEAKVHKLEESVNILLKNINVVESFGYGGFDLPKYRAGMAL